MKIEQLAEIGHEAFTKVMGYTNHAWASLSDRTKDAKIAQTVAIIREVLGPVTRQEYAYVGNDAATVLASRLSQLTQDVNKSPPNVQSPPEIETQVEISDAEVDAVGTLIHAAIVAQQPMGWQPTREQADSIARAAISAMRGKLVGVWAKRVDGTLEEWVSISHGSYKHTTDKDLANYVVSYLAIGNDQWTYSVREYTEPAEVPKEAVEAGVRAYQQAVESDPTEYGPDDETRVRAVLTAAMPHWKGAK